MAKAPGHTGKIDFYKFQIKPTNFTDTKDYKAAIGNFANWFAYNRTRALAVKNGMIRAFNNFDNMNVGACTINDREFRYDIPYNLGDNRSRFNQRVLNFAVGGGTPDAKALQFLGERFETEKGVVTSPCQKNYAILFTDGYNNGTNPDTEDIDNDGVENSMADLAAKYYYDMDIPPEPPNWNENLYGDWSEKVKEDLVPTSYKCDKKHHDPSIDCQQELHVTFFAVTLGQTGNVFGTSDQPDPYKSGTNLNNNKHDSLKSNVKTGIWPTEDQLFVDDRTASDSAAQVDDLWHATVNTRGALLNATRPAELQKKFTKILRNVLNKELSGNNLALNRNSASAGSFIYQATFQGRRGLLQAYPFTGNSIPHFNATPEAPGWSVANGDIRDAASRNIFTRIDSTNLIFDISLAGSALLPDSYKLNTAKIKYIRGHSSNEGPNSDDFRGRSGYVLGDIIHSTPVYVGSTPGYAGYIGQFPSAPSYKTFITETSGRTPALYVEANDGMLHAFNASKKSDGGGDELFAYIPEAVLPKIHELTQQYPNHRFYADATVTVEDAVINDRWATVLVAGLRAGGKSIFALDVTNPADFKKSYILWEITPEDDGFKQLGLTYSQPQIVRLNTGQWAAVFGNGYNSADNKAVLYVVDLADGSLIKKFVISDKDVSDPRSGANGMSSPYAVDLNRDFITDYVYAGDLHGNMWRFDLTSSDPDDWSATLLFQTSARPDNDGDSGTPPPARAITSAPVVALGPPGVTTRRGTMVFFGSGKYLETSDAEGQALNSTNYLYGIWDAKVGNGTPAKEFDSATVDPDELATRELGAEQTADDGNVYGTLENPDMDINYEHGNTSKSYYRGWRLDLGDNGQRIINQPSFTSKGNLTGTSSIPSPRLCTAGGITYLYRLDPYTGGPTDTPAFDVNGDGAFTIDDKLQITDEGGNTTRKSAVFQRSELGVAGGIRTVILPDGSRKTIITSSQGHKKSRFNAAGDSARRLSWREIRRGD